MSDIKIIYFDFDGSRGEVARLALTIGGVEFEDDRVEFADWKARKPKMPFGAMPVLEVDGRMVAQSNAINRYVGKLAGLYPTDPWQAALCDEIMDAVEDVSTKVVSTFGMKGKELETARVALVDGPVSYFLKRIGSRLQSQGGEWFADDRLTVADLKVFLWVRTFGAGVLDHVPTDLPDRVAPELVEHRDRVASHPVIEAYYDARATPPG